ncbi:histidine kinase dimerization/phospho-acceptor domain-containing protein [Paracerasibacillus soli]|uniref:histidine kinase n=1 Tax=Paracerasibacillus soli TaxID=480284 RepID=A0ABU5CPH1_9BACI|nr:histidine kinase dimerization/phospho-acceptor domain-containing protein [Virgibacillus soli]MDY0408234.1 histidine kinase dimerization/phospho-acceptor domain-containing protein [Virgibacillus soli]
MKNNRPLHNVKSLPLEILNWIENNSNDVITIWNQSGKLLFVSDSVEQLLGFKANAITNKSWNTFLTVEDAHYISKKFTNEINVKQMFNIPLFNHNDLPVWCGITAVKLVAHHEPYYVAILKDITDKKEAEELMIRSEKMSIAGQLAAGIAHEIRNPLTSLKGFLQLLQAGVEQKDVYYKIMIDEIIKMEQITSELLYISKPLTDFKQDESLRTMIQDVIELLNTQAKLKDITLTHQQENNIFLHCDRSQIKQVLINIVKNAIEAMDSTGKSLS